MKKLIYLFCLLAVTVVSAQDYPHSVGPVPVIDNQALVPEVFTSANPNSRALTFISTGATKHYLAKQTLINCNHTIINQFIFYFPGAVTRVTPNRHYVLDQIGIRLFRYDTLGNQTMLGSITGSPLSNLTGMTWDATTNTMFVVATSLTQSQIGTLDTATRIVTPIGSPSTVCQGAISISAAPSGSLFVIDITNDNFYRVNKTSGVFILISSLGVSTNFGQDAQFDYDGKLYWVTYLLSTPTGPQLRVLDTASGLSTQICHYGTVNQVTAIAPIPMDPPAVNFCRNGLSIPIINLFPVSDSIFINLGSGGVVHDVNVRIDTVIHTFDGDLRFYLRRVVGNVGVKIINHVGGGGDNFIGTVLDDEASVPIASGTSPFTGSFIPFNPLAPFDGPFNSGYWKLVISDTVGADTGLLRAWCLSISATTTVGAIHTIEIPNTYRLYQNYPNPFNPTTKIKFGLPKNSHVKLTVYDVLGREVRVLINEHKQANTYEVEFDGSTLPSGVYFYKLESEDFTTTKKMLMLK